jgi:KTSC domain
VLTVEYVSGGRYEYYGVEPALFEELLRSQPHPWSRVGERVKAHPYRRV